jgi:hypothetical protein
MKLSFIASFPAQAFDPPSFSQPVMSDNVRDLLPRRFYGLSFAEPRRKTS